jgi:hypothetical protein
MRAHLAGQADELALLAMEDEHGRIDPLLDAVDAPTAELSGHLAHEERDTLPLLDRSLTPAEWQGFVADQRRKNGIPGGRAVLALAAGRRVGRAGPGGPCGAAGAAAAGLPPHLAARYAPYDHWEPSTPPLQGRGDREHPAAGCALSHPN